MKKLFDRIPTLVFLCGAAVLAVFVYNTWSFCCGRCSAANFLRFGPTGFLFLGVNVLAVFALLLLRRRRRHIDRQQQCRCGAALREGWLFCPDCGSLSGTVPSTALQPTGKQQ